jgi:hypothetical protein
MNTPSRLLTIRIAVRPVSAWMRQTLWVLLALWLFVNVVDLVTTAAILGRHGWEVNPILAAIHGQQGFGGMVIAKLVVVASEMAVIIVVRRALPRFAFASLILADLWIGFAALNNTVLLVR